MFFRMSGFVLLFFAFTSYAAINRLVEPRAGFAIQAHAGIVEKPYLAENEKGRYVGLVLEHMDFSDRDLRGVSFSLSRLVSVDFAGAMLSGSDFSSTVSERVDFTGANLEVTSFRGAKLLEVNFAGANLQGACFLDADLSGVDFTGADLSGAVMPGSQRNSVNLKDAVTKDTIWNGGGECPGGNRKFADVNLAAE